MSFNNIDLDTPTDVDNISKAVNRCEKTDGDVTKFISPEHFGDAKQQIHDILQHDYGLTLTSYRQLDGFDDINYLVEVTGSDVNPYIELQQSSRFLLRIINANDSQEPKRIEAINTVMKHVRAKGIVTQEIIKNLKGNEISFLDISTEGQTSSHVIVLRTYIPGVNKRLVDLSSTHLFDFGAYIANITHALEDFHHSFFDTFTFSLSLSNLANLKDMLQQAVPDLSRRQLADDILDACDDRISLMGSRLRRGQIHGDIALSNVIFPHVTESIDDDIGFDLNHRHRPSKDNTPQSESNDAPWVPGMNMKLWGLVDFHDTHHSSFIQELAISSSRLLMRKGQTQTPPPIHPIDIPGHLLAGYTSIISVNCAEREIFPYMVISDFCILLIFFQYYSNLNPKNGYLKEGQSGDWTLLEYMWKTTPAKLQAKWDKFDENYNYSRC